MDDRQQPAAGEADGAVLEGAFVAGPAGLQRRIEAWLADNGHGAAAEALAEMDIDTILEASL